MEKIILNLADRSIKGKAVAELRKAGQTPAVIYGHGEETRVVQADTKIMTKIYQQFGSSKIVSVKLDDGKLKNALFHDVSLDPVTGVLQHADLYLVRMDEKLDTEVPLHFIGESTAVYQLEGTLVKNLETLEIRALPANLPESIEVDISVLDDFEKSIHVSDLIIPKNVEVLEEMETLVAKVDEPRSDEELAELDSEVVEELPEGVAEEVVAENPTKP